MGCDLGRVEGGFAGRRSGFRRRLGGFAALEQGWQRDEPEGCPGETEAPGERGEAVRRLVAIAAEEAEGERPMEETVHQ